MILNLYEKYLKELNNIKENLKKQNSENLRSFEIVMLKAMCELYQQLHYFNFNVDILNLILKYSLSKSTEIRQVVWDFIHFILTTENQSFYKSKLLILEKLGSFLKTKKLFYLISEKIWESFTDIYFEYANEIDDKTNKV